MNGKMRLMGWSSSPSNLLPSSWDTLTPPPSSLPPLFYPPLNTKNFLFPLPTTSLLKPLPSRTYQPLPPSTPHALRTHQPFPPSNPPSLHPSSPPPILLLSCTSCGNPCSLCGETCYSCGYPYCPMAPPTPLPLWCPCSSCGDSCSCG